MHDLCARGVEAACTESRLLTLDVGEPDAAKRAAQELEDDCRRGQLRACGAWALLATEGYGFVPRDPDAAAQRGRAACDGDFGAGCAALAKLAPAGSDERERWAERGCGLMDATACDMTKRAADASLPTKTWTAAQLATLRRMGFGLGPAFVPMAARCAPQPYGRYALAACRRVLTLEACSLGSRGSCAAWVRQQADLLTFDPTAPSVADRTCAAGFATACEADAILRARSGDSAAAAGVEQGCASGNPSACGALASLTLRRPTDARARSQAIDQLEAACRGGLTHYCGTAAVALEEPGTSSAADLARARSLRVLGCDGGDRTQYDDAVRMLLDRRAGVPDPDAALARVASVDEPDATTLRLGALLTRGRPDDLREVVALASQRPGHCADGRHAWSAAQRLGQPPTLSQRRQACLAGEASACRGLAGPDPWSGMRARWGWSHGSSYQPWPQAETVCRSANPPYASASSDGSVAALSGQCFDAATTAFADGNSARGAAILGGMCASRWITPEFNRKACDALGRLRATGQGVPRIPLRTVDESLLDYAWMMGVPWEPGVPPRAVGRWSARVIRLLEQARTPAHVAAATFLGHAVGGARLFGFAPDGEVVQCNGDAPTPATARGEEPLEGLKVGPGKIYRTFCRFYDAYLAYCDYRSSLPPEQKDHFYSANEEAEASAELQRQGYLEEKCP
jgi:hypothetical protein